MGYVSRWKSIPDVQRTGRPFPVVLHIRNHEVQHQEPIVIAVELKHSETGCGAMAGFSKLPRKQYRALLDSETGKCRSVPWRRSMYSKWHSIRNVFDNGEHGSTPSANTGESAG